jgi:hypothetical protein
MALDKIGKSFDYRAICDVCGFKKWSYELRQRWDGLMVCKEDWEPRNVLDFYRTRNDAHRLPWTRPDADSNGTVWTPTFTGFSSAFSSTLNSAYEYDSISKKFSYSLVLVLANPCTVTNGATISLPAGYTVSADKGGTVRGSLSGSFYSKCTASGTNIVITTGFTITPPDSILVTGSFTST